MSNSLSDTDFLSGNYNFTGTGRKSSIINKGTITAADGGYVALLAPQVKNEGIVTAKLGTVAFGASERVTLNMSGDSLIGLAVDKAAFEASITNKGLVQADGGTVIMTARTASDLASTVVNNSGIIQARSISNKNGVITLEGGEAAVANSGTLDATGRDSGQSGGKITVTGGAVTIATGSIIDASGDSGGGQILMGGNYQGQGPEQNAKTTTISEGTVRPTWCSLSVLPIPAR